MCIFCIGQILVITACKAFYEASGCRYGEREESEKCTRKYCANYACSGKGNAEKNYGKKSCSEYADDKSRKHRTQTTYSRIRALCQRDREQDDCKISYGDSERNPQESRGNGYCRADGKKSANDADDDTCNDCEKRTAEFTTTIIHTFVHLLHYTV